MGEKTYIYNHGGPPSQLIEKSTQLSLLNMDVKPKSPDTENISTKEIKINRTD